MSRQPYFAKLAYLQESLAPGEVSRWGEAVGNIEDARVALNTLARAIEDAVYLDEDAYNQVAPVMQYQRTMQVLCGFLRPSVSSCFSCAATKLPYCGHTLSCCRCSNSG